MAEAGVAVERVPEWANKVYHGDSRVVLRNIPDESVHLVVTSPPYNVGIGYNSHNDSLPHDEYMYMLQEVWYQCKRLLVPGGRLCVNVAGGWRNPYIPLPDMIAAQLNNQGWTQRGEIIWDKNTSRNDSTAWGSFCQPSMPTLRDIHEYILVFSKGEQGLPPQGKGDITSEEFIKWTLSIWRFQALQSNRRGDNPCPAPFPPELPLRLIKLYTYPGMTVLDPFMGGGTTCIAARTYGRQFVGVDVDRASCNYAAFALGCDVIAGTADAGPGMR